MSKSNRFVARQRRARLVFASASAFIASMSCAIASAAPTVSSAFASKLTIAPATPTGDVTVASQMTWGPDGRLYVARAESEIVSYAYNSATHSLSDKRGTGVVGMGVAFGTHSARGGPVANYMYVSHRLNVNGTEAILSRYSDSNHNFTWGESGAGETNVDIVRGVPLGDHSMNQIQIVGNSLYVGIGCRTFNGRAGDHTSGSYHDTPTGTDPGGEFGGINGFTYGETSYNGTMCRIGDLSLVANTTSAAQLRDGPNGTSGNLLAGRDAFLPGGAGATLPYTSTAQDKLIVQSAGTRNPFGIAADSNGNVYFTNNHGRADTNGNGTSTPHPLDHLDSDLSNDVGDQFFKATAGGDYRYDNTNFRGNGAFPATPIDSITFDNLKSTAAGFNVLHNPANPNGLGPSSSANGFEFVTIDGQEVAVISRWSDVVTEESPGTDTLTFSDFVIVDPTTGQTRRALEGFANPIDALRDPDGKGFMVADYTTGTIYHVSIVPEPTSATVLASITIASMSRRRRRPL